VAKGGQELRPKHVGAIINHKKIVQKVGIKYYIVVVTLCRPDGSGLEIRWAQTIFSPPYPSRWVLGSTQPPVKKGTENHSRD
jgi:hypothetical protein